MQLFDKLRQIRERRDRQIILSLARTVDPNVVMTGHFVEVDDDTRLPVVELRDRGSVLGLYAASLSGVSGKLQLTRAHLDRENEGAITITETRSTIVVLMGWGQNSKNTVQRSSDAAAA